MTSAQETKVPLTAEVGELHISRDEAIQHAPGELSFEWEAIHRDEDGRVTHYESRDAVFHDDSWYGGKSNGVTVVIHTFGSRWVIVVAGMFLRGRPCRSAWEGRIRAFKTALAAARSAEQHMCDGGAE